MNNFKDQFWDFGRNHFISVLALLVGIIVSVLLKTFIADITLLMSIGLTLLFILTGTIIDIFISNKRVQKQLLLEKNNVETTYQKLLAELKKEVNEKTSLIENKLKNENDKLNRMLLMSNAIIEDKNKKLSITAKVLDFYADNEYRGLINDNENSIAETIDIIRVFSYQDFLFSHRYISYLLFKHNKTENATKIIVVSDSDCQATLMYIHLCVELKYNTYVISKDKFKKFYELNTPFIKSNDNEAKRKMIKGNPFMYKCNEKIGGRYTDYGQLDKPIKLESPHNLNEYWKLLQNLKNESEKIIGKTYLERNGLNDILKS